MKALPSGGTQRSTSTCASVTQRRTAAAATGTASAPAARRRAASLVRSRPSTSAARPRAHDQFRDQHPALAGRIVGRRPAPDADPGRAAVAAAPGRGEVARLRRSPGRCPRAARARAAPGRRRWPSGSSCSRRRQEIGRDQARSRARPAGTRSALRSSAMPTGQVGGCAQRRCRRGACTLSGKGISVVADAVVDQHLPLAVGRPCARW